MKAAVNLIHPLDHSCFGSAGGLWGVALLVAVALATKWLVSATRRPRAVSRAPVPVPRSECVELIFHWYGEHHSPICSVWHAYQVQGIAGRPVRPLARPINQGCRSSSS